MATDLTVTINKAETISRLIAWARTKFDVDPDNPLTPAELKSNLEWHMRDSLRAEVLKWEREAAADTAYNSVPSIED